MGGDRALGRPLEPEAGKGRATAGRTHAHALWSSGWPQAGSRRTLGLGDLSVALEGFESSDRESRGPAAGLAPTARDGADILLRVRCLASPVAPSDAVRVALSRGLSLALAGDAQGVGVAELEGERVRRVLRLDAARRRGEIELATRDREAGLAPLAPPFDGLLLATRLAREGALLLEAAAVGDAGDHALAFTRRTRRGEAVLEGFLDQASGPVLARRRLIVRRGPQGWCAVSGAVRQNTDPVPSHPLAAIHLVQSLPAGAPGHVERRWGPRAADALLASAMLPIDPPACEAVYAAACALAEGLPILRVGCATPEDLARLVRRPSPGVRTFSSARSGALH